MENWKSKLKMRLPALLLLAVTVLFWALFDRYEPAGPVFLDNPSLGDAFKVRGDVSTDESAPGRFLLNVPEGGKQATVVYRFEDADKYQFFRAKARVSFEGIKLGKQLWCCARVVVFQRDQNGKWNPSDHKVMGGYGSSEGKHYEEIIELIPETRIIDFCLQQHGTQGSAVYEDLFLQPLRVRTAFFVWQIIFAVIWMGVAAFYFNRCRLHQRPLRLLIILNVVAIIAGALVPSDWLDVAADTSKEIASSLAPEKPIEVVNQKREKMVAGKSAAKSVGEADADVVEPFPVDEQSAGHFILFASLCLFVYLSGALEKQPFRHHLKVGFDIFIFAVITETLQLMTLDRTAHPTDLLLDVGGMVLAMAIFLIGRLVWRTVFRKSVVNV